MARHANDASSASHRGQVGRLRYEAGLTQMDLAVELGVSLRTIQRIERGQTVPRPRLAARLADRLGVAISDLNLQEAA